MSFRTPLTRQDVSERPTTARVFFLWGIAVFASSLLTVLLGAVFRIRSVVLFCGPAAVAANRLLPRQGIPIVALDVLRFVFLMVHYMFFHAGLLLALWRWQARWLWLEPVAFVASAYTALTF